MSSLSVALPLSIDATNGFAMNTSLAALVKQNLKMLILTNNTAAFRIIYTIPNLGVQDLLEFTI